VLCVDGALLRALLLLAVDSILGSMSFIEHVPSARRVEIGCIWVTPAAQGRGTVREGVYLLMRHALQELRYRRLEWKCDSLNVRSRRMALRLGFRYEGLFRKHMIIKGRSRDTAWFSITDDEWRLEVAALAAPFLA
jgi:RimJ/RimL family protein N-acetyltransferase